MRIRLKMAGLVIFALSFYPVFSQPTEITYLGTTIKEGSANDESYGPFNIGFTFTFYGTAYTQFYASSNGLITFGTGSTSNLDATIPSSTLPDNFIAPFWDDLKIDTYGNILYAVIGAAPNRKLVVQFRNMGFYPSPIYMGTFSVILYETSNIIQTQYRMIMLQDVARSKGGEASLGVENADGTSGTQFASHSSSAVNSWKAISYTFSAGTYTADGNAVYDGIYLTKNLAAPEPGITDLVSPADGSTVGVDVTFQWGVSEYATKYYLRVANNPEMTGATTYYNGTDLTYTKTGLTDGVTYYWTVLAYNTTGFTWNEVRKFTVSSSPPLTAVPQVVWTEQGADKTISLNYTGGDGGPKTAIITSLPAQGQLFQYNAGVKGTQITSLPETVSDAGRRAIYTAPGSSGNGIGNFNFKMNDGTGDSPDATVTVNVSPPGIPNVLYVAKGSGVEIQLDRLMADPSGKHNQFTVTVNGSPATLAAATLKTGDPYTISLTLSTPLAGTETVLVSYTQGDVTSAQGGFLLSFADMPVTLRQQTITFTQSLSKKYNESPFNLTATASSGLSLTYASSNLSVATISGAAVTLHATGAADITARQSGNATWAPARYIRTLNVDKGDQTITFNSLADKTFGDADFNLSATSSSGLAVTYTSDNTDFATVTGNTVHIVGAGTVNINALQAGNSNWNAATPVPQALTVHKADQTISFGALPLKTFGDADFNISATSGSGLAVTFTSDNTDAATVTGNTIHIVGAGAAVINALQSGDANWNSATPVPQTLTVQKADQTISFGALPLKTFGDVDFSISASSGSALAVTFTSDNTDVATVTGNTIHIVGAGAAVINALQPGDANWNAASPVPQTLTVQKSDQTISFGVLPVKQTSDPDFSPGATSSSGLPISYISANPAVATITGGMIHIVGEGTSLITAKQPGNDNYNAATDADQLLEVAFTTGVDNPVFPEHGFNYYISQGWINIQLLNPSWENKAFQVRMISSNGNIVHDSKEIHFSLDSTFKVRAPEKTGLYLIEISSGIIKTVIKVLIN